MSPRRPMLDARAAMLLVVCLSLAAVLATEVILLGRAQAVEAPISTGEAPQARSLAAMQPAVLPSSPPLASLSEITARPLFSESRRPPVVPVEAATQAAETLVANNWRLTGVAMDGQTTLAILRHRSGNQTLRLAPGMSVDGWRLEEISAQEVVFVAGDRRVSLPLRQPPGAPARKTP